MSFDHLYKLRHLNREEQVTYIEKLSELEAKELIVFMLEEEDNFHNVMKQAILVDYRPDYLSDAEMKDIDEQSKITEIKQFLQYHRKSGKNFSNYDKWIENKADNDVLPLPVIRKLIREHGTGYVTK